ncbi:Sterol 26-hydroxylase, mitochondrial [Anabarilius grahami]|uniref:Sterol 26-hydroxylase, mitochondrial n=1 Tax=Anabarilius grahami TaxID=495550 RepID=A0A3N0YW72_ANAGA|nr:Sterol 26-hydroxylase, mitochondrial [Anabarilius grahami]
MFFNREGEKWYKLRRVLNKRMLHPKDSVQYGDVVNAVVTDFIKRIYYLREMSPTGDLVPNLTNELYRFSLEARKMIDMKMKAIQRRVDANQEVAGEYLTYLLSNVKMSSKDVYGSISELLLAGVDSTSNTMMWALYLLSRDPEAQEALYQDVTRVLKGDTVPTAQEVNNMPYLKAVIKETLRMYPVVPMNSRLISENDVVIGGHFFPKKTTFSMSHYAISRDEKVFPEAWKFKPDRWLRDGRTRPNPFGSIPFGFGVRGCVGRRIAELEMHLALARLIKLFEIRPDPTVGEVQSVYRSVLAPDRQVNLHFVERPKTHEA